MARQPFPKILGINQLADETALVVEDKMFVREATNIDIDTVGNTSRRKGASLQLAGAGYHSLYRTNRNWLMLCRKYELGTYVPSTATFTALVTMPEAYYTSYAELNGNLYAMNQAFSCMFMPGSTTSKPIGVPLPSVDVEFYVTASGDFEEGTYGIAYTIVDPDGEESGLSDVTTLTLTAGQGIGGTLFSVMANYMYRVYMTTANGEELHQAAEFDADSVTVEILTPEQGRVAETFGLEPPPKGHFIRAFGSRLFIATTDYVYFTEAFRPHLHDPRNFVKTNGVTLLLEPVDGGVFIGDKDGVRFYAGDDPTSWRIQESVPEAPIYGTGTTVPGSYFSGELNKFDSVAVWLSSSGYVLGTPNGEIMRLNAGQVQLPSYVQGVTAVKVADGRKQLITAVNSNKLAGAGVALDSVIA